MITTYISVKPIQPLYFRIQIMLFQIPFWIRKISVAYNFILKTDTMFNLKNEIYLTQMSMLTEVCTCYSYKRHIKL